MDCKEIAGKLYEYIDREIDEETCNKIKWHLENCPECHSRFKFEENLLKAICECVHCDLPPGLREKICRALEEENKRNQA